jgi:tripartite-type tricarboxylate transporter receptor subunit TctC
VRPGTPADRVAMLREALAKTLTDPQFLAEAKKAKIHMEAVSADEVTKGFTELLNQPPRVLDAMNKYLKVGGG